MSKEVVYTNYWVKGLAGQALYNGCPFDLVIPVPWGEEPKPYLAMKLRQLYSCMFPKYGVRFEFGKYDPRQDRRKRFGEMARC